MCQGFICEYNGVKVINRQIHVQFYNKIPYVSVEL